MKILTELKLYLLAVHLFGDEVKSRIVTIDERLTIDCPICGGKLNQDPKYGGTDCDDCYTSFSNGEAYLSKGLLLQLFNNDTFLSLPIIILKNNKIETVELKTIKDDYIKQFYLGYMNN